MRPLIDTRRIRHRMARGAFSSCILVVEDDPQLQMLMRWQLESARFESLGAADGYEALRVIEATKPDLVLLDLMMPYMDGWAVLTELRQWPTMPPVIVTSAMGLNAQRQR